MNKQYSQGDRLADRYRLKQQLSADHLTSRWAAYDESMGESVHLVIFKAPVSANTQQTLRRILARQKGLLHARIVPVYEFAEAGGQAFYTSQATDQTAGQARTFRHEGSFQKQWQLLRQLVETLAYAHSLGFCHGLLSPDNLLVCDARLHLLNMGVAPFVGDTTSACASPDLCLDNAPTPADDVYGLGQLLYKALTGEYRDPSAPVSNQLPAVIGPLLLNMLRIEALRRPTDLHKLKQSIDDYIAGNAAGNAAGNNQTSASRNHPPVADSQDTVIPAHMLPRDRVTISGWWALSGLCLLLGIGGGLFFFRPLFLPNIEPQLHGGDSKARSQPVVSSEKTPGGVIETPLAPLAAAKLKRLQADGQAMAQQLLRRQVELEDQGGTVWATVPYQQAVATGLQGDAAYDDRQYQAALDFYREAMQIVQNSIDQVDVVFAKNLALGEAALKRGDARQAIEAFTILKAIRAADASIKNSLVRAENLDEVQRLVHGGSIHEREGELHLALASYQSALSLDSQWPAARQGISRIKQALAERQFNQQMSRAFRALNNSSYDQAKTFFNRAQRLKPASSAPKDGLDQLLVRQNNAAIARHKNAASKLIAQEQWQAVIDEYESILGIASGSQFAHQESAQARVRLTLNNRLDRFINKPTLMMADKALGEAKKTLLEANGIPSKGPRLRKQINQLSHYVSQARVPVQVTLISDNKTLVTVYRVGALGRFASQSLSLIPGVYTVVGKRQGYRDVSFEIRLKGGESARSLTVSCTERI